MNPEPHFDGSDYISSLDKARLTGQILRIFDCMADGTYRTLNEIAGITGDPEASISAQLRNLRKERFGGHTIMKRRRSDKVCNPGSGLFEYKL